MDIIVTLAIVALAVGGTTALARTLGKLDADLALNRLLNLPTNTVAGTKHHTPYRAHDLDAGADLRANESTTIEPGERALVPAGVKVAIPAGMAGLVCPRSGMAHKHGVTVLNAPGVVDAGYTGEVKVNLINLGSDPFHIHKGDRIAQLVQVPVNRGGYVAVDSLDDTERGASGHGSTGRA